jgi:hypothetical protein
MNLTKCLLTRAGLLAASAFLAVSAQAVPFNYTEGDVLVCFRVYPSGSYDLVVDAGPVSNYTNLPVGSQIVISPNYYSGSQLGVIGTNDIAWSAFAYYKSGSNPNTIFMSNPWDYTQDPATYPQPWSCGSPNAQGLTVAYLANVAFCATNANPGGSDSTITANASATATLVAETRNTAPYLSYYNGLGLPNHDDFHGTFEGYPEQVTGPTFTTDGINFRSDFYRLTPGPYGGGLGPDGDYLGYFEFSTNGVMTFTAQHTHDIPVVAATNVTITRSGTTNTVSFTTGASGTYTLYGTNNVAAPISTWPAIGQVTGNGGQQSITDVTTGGKMFYTVGAQ